MSRKNQAMKIVEDFVPPLSGLAPDNVASKAANLAGDIHGSVVESNIDSMGGFVSKYTGKLGSWLRSRTRTNL